MYLSLIIWNGSPEIFSIGPLTLRWYGLLFASGFLISQQILYYIFRKEGKPTSDVDALTIYMVISTVVGARLGHIIFYQPEIITQDPLSIFLPFKFHPFQFTGLQGLASHGAAFGILFALWLYSRKKKPGQNFLQTVDRIVIVVALTGALIRFGNFFNSEIIGKPYDGPTSVLFISEVTENIKRASDASVVESITVKKDLKAPAMSNARVPIDLYIFFKPGIKEPEAQAFLNGTVRNALLTSKEFIEESGMMPLRVGITTDTLGNLGAKVQTVGIARHPAQLYESISCVLLFLLLYWIWTLKKENTAPGRIFGVFLIICWSLRFVYEFLKEPQVDFERTMSFDMGQILSIPLIIAGVIVLIWSFKKTETTGTVN